MAPINLSGTFCAHERAYARGAVTHPVTAEYVRRLERVARAANALLNEKTQHSNTGDVRASSVLDTELAALDYMDGDRGSGERDV